MWWWKDSLSLPSRIPSSWLSVSPHSFFHGRWFFYLGLCLMGVPECCLNPCWYLFLLVSPFSPQQVFFLTKCDQQLCFEMWMVRLQGSRQTVGKSQSPDRELGLAFRMQIGSDSPGEDVHLHVLDQASCTVLSIHCIVMPSYHPLRKMFCAFHLKHEQDIMKREVPSPLHGRA